MPDDPTNTPPAPPTEPATVPPAAPEAQLVNEAVASLQTALVDAQRRLDQYTTENHQFAAKIQELSTERDAVNTKVGELEAQLAGLLAKAQTAQANAEISAATIATLTSERDTARGEVATLTSERNAAQQAASNAQQEYTAVSLTIVNVEEAIKARFEALNMSMAGFESLTTAGRMGALFEAYKARVDDDAKGTASENADMANANRDLGKTLQGAREDLFNRVSKLAVFASSKFGNGSPAAQAAAKASADPSITNLVAAFTSLVDRLASDSDGPDNVLSNAQAFSTQGVDPSALAQGIRAAAAIAATSGKADRLLLDVLADQALTARILGEAVKEFGLADPAAGFDSVAAKKARDQFVADVKAQGDITAILAAAVKLGLAFA